MKQAKFGALSGVASAAQGLLADSAVQPGDLATREANAASGTGFSLTIDGTGHHYIVPVEG